MPDRLNIGVVIGARIGGRNMVNMPFTIGADPEVFFIKDGRYVPAIGLVGGTKESPRRLDIGAVQEDNVMAEFNIPPASTEEEFSKYIFQMLGVVKKIAKETGHKVDIVPYATFDGELLKHPQAINIGCIPDFNAWTYKKNPTMDADTLGNIRVAAGHIHIGVPNPDIMPNFRTNLARACDIFLGIPSLFIDSDVTRRNFYGRAGAFRPKAYGIEYRVLSNKWIEEKYLRRWVFKQTQYAVNYAYNNQKMNRGDYTNSIIECINKGNIVAAEELCRIFKIAKPNSRI